MTIRELYTESPMIGDHTVLRIKEPVVDVLGRTTCYKTVKGFWYEDAVLGYAEREISGLEYKREDDTVTIIVEREEARDGWT